MKDGAPLAKWMRERDRQTDSGRNAGNLEQHLTGACLLPVAGFTGLCSPICSRFVCSAKAREQALRGNRDIYVLGAANVGKSTFINYIIEDR